MHLALVRLLNLETIQRTAEPEKRVHEREKKKNLIQPVRFVSSKWKKKHHARNT